MNKYRKKQRSAQDTIMTENKTADPSSTAPNPEKAHCFSSCTIAHQIYT
jgi:hypothetical protein